MREVAGEEREVALRCRKGVGLDNVAATTSLSRLQQKMKLLRSQSCRGAELRPDSKVQHSLR